MHGIDTLVPHFFSRIWGTRIVVTPKIVSKVLHIPRVAHSDCLGCEHLRTMSKEELSSRFCKTPSSWDDRQNTPCLGFTKGPRFLNMVMTFVFHPLSHYNSITEPRARFLLSLLEDISIDFPSHFILSLINVYRDTATRNKLIFLRLSHGFFAIFSFPFPFLFPLLWLIPHLHLLSQRVVWHLRRSWRSYSAWMLALTHSVMSCVKWTPVLAVLPHSRLTLMASWHLPLLLLRHPRMMTMRCLLDILTLCHS